MNAECTTVRDLFGTTDEAERARVAAHIAGCEVCRAAHDSFESVGAELSTTGAAMRASDFTARVLGRLDLLASERQPPSAMAADRSARDRDTTGETNNNPPDPIDTGDGTLHAVRNALRVVKHGKFRLVHPLGKGGSANVVKARDLALKREVAIKRLRQPDDERALIRFIDEAQITSQLTHPNIVPVYELGVDDETGEPLLAMKRVRGRTLQVVINAAHNRLRADASTATQLREERALLEIFLKVCDAIAYAHSRGVIHRDLKPDNVMVGEFGEVIVMDWGLAKPLDSDPDAPHTDTRVTSDRRLAGLDATIDGTVAGTLPYMPPEQARGQIDKLDQRADVYALGAMLYVMLTGAAPFAADDRDALLRAVIEAPLVPPSTRGAPMRVAADLEAVVIKAMQRSRSLRYQSVPELRRDVERYLEGRTVGVADYTSLELLQKWVKRNRIAVIGGAATLLAVTTGLIVALVLAAQAEREKLLVVEQRLARVEAEARTAEALAQSEASAREADARAHDAERQRHLNLLLEGQVDELVQQLGGKRRRDFDAAVAEFNAIWREQRPRYDTNQAFLDAMGDRAGKYLVAYDALFGFAAEHPDEVTLDADDYLMRGILRHCTADLAGALADYARAAELDATITTPYNNAGVILRTLGEYDAAIDQYDQGLAIDRFDAGLWMNRGNVQRDKGEYGRAIADYDEALLLDPEFASAYDNRARAQLAMRAFDRAFADYTQAIRFNPTAHAYISRGNAFFEADRVDDALDDYNTALQLEPDNAWALNNRGVMYKIKGDYDAALADYARAIAISGGDSDAYGNRARLYRILDRPLNAVADLTDLIRLRPDRTVALTMRADLFKDHGYAQAAIDDLARAIAIDPAHAGAHRERAALHAAQGALELAIADFQRAVAIEDAWRDWLNLAIALATADQRDAAADAFAGALERCPEAAREGVEQARRRALGD